MASSGEFQGFPQGGPQQRPEWYSRPEVVEAERRITNFGDPTQYPKSRLTVNGKSTYDPHNYTDFVVGQATWEETNLPDIMYWLEPPEDWMAAKIDGPAPPFMVDVNGSLVMERWPEDDTNPRPIRYLPVLPDRISSYTELWVVEAWRRLDPKIEWLDINMRIPKTHTRKDDPTHGSSLARPYRAHFWSNKCGTMRREYTFQLSWHSTHDIWDSKSAKDMRENLSERQIEQNTTRGLTPGKIDPKGPNVLHNLVPWKKEYQDLKKGMAENDYGKFKPGKLAPKGKGKRDFASGQWIDGLIAGNSAAAARKAEYDTYIRERALGRNMTAESHHPDDPEGLPRATNAPFNTCEGLPEAYGLSSNTPRNPPELSQIFPNVPDDLPALPEPFPYTLTSAPEASEPFPNALDFLLGSYSAFPNTLKSLSDVSQGFPNTLNFPLEASEGSFPYFPNLPPEAFEPLTNESEQLPEAYGRGPYVPEALPRVPELPSQDEAFFAKWGFKRE